MISPNRTLISPVLGAESPSLVVYSHQGDVPGNTGNIYVIPKSKSAIVILSNGTGLGDATDWIAQDIIQTISGLHPEVDFVTVAEQAKKLYLSHYTKDFKDPLERHRGSKKENVPPPRLTDFVGTYVMGNLDVAFVEVSLDESSDPDSLQMKVNGFDDHHYCCSTMKTDVFSYLPDTFDNCLKRGLDRTLCPHSCSFSSATPS